MSSLLLPQPALSIFYSQLIAAFDSKHRLKGIFFLLCTPTRVLNFEISVARSKKPVLYTKYLTQRLHARSTMIVAGCIAILFFEALRTAPETLPPHPHTSRALSSAAAKGGTHSASQPASAPSPVNLTPTSLPDTFASDLSL